MKTLKISFVAILCTLHSLSFSQADPGGGGCIECPTATSDPCISGASTWFLGGNIITGGGFGQNLPGPVFDIGTCNEFPFVLKANNNKSVFVLPNSRIGIGYLNSSPSAVLDIRDGNNANPSNFRIYADASGNLESTTDITLNYASTKSFAINEGAVGTGINRLFLQNGKMGINNSSPAANLDILDPGTAEIRVQSSSSSNSSIWALNSISSYNMGLDNSGIGFIGSNISSPMKLIQFKINNSTNTPQVWIGKRPTTGTHTDFSLAVDGKLVTNSLYVTLQGNWADFVFEKNYKLMPLSDLENYYKTHRHLPGIPSTEEVKENGLNLEEMNTMLLLKVEELTLYMVELKKELDALKNSSK